MKKLIVILCLLTSYLPYPVLAFEDYNKYGRQLEEQRERQQREFDRIQEKQRQFQEDSQRQWESMKQEQDRQERQMERQRRNTYE